MIFPNSWSPSILEAIRAEVAATNQILALSDLLSYRNDLYDIGLLATSYDFGVSFSWAIPDCDKCGGMGVLFDSPRSIEPDGRRSPFKVTSYCTCQPKTQVNTSPVDGGASYVPRKGKRFK